MTKTLPTGEQIIKQVRAEFGPKTLLSFSRGKDSIAAWLAIRPHFDEVVAYHLYLVPGLEFVDESRHYYEKFFGCRIFDLPHPSLYRMLARFQYQTPGNAAVLEAARLPEFDYQFLHHEVAKEAGLDGRKVLGATGVRAADSPARRVAMITHGAINRSRRVYYPVWDWNKARLVEALNKSGVKLPIDYEWFGRSFDGIDLRFVYQIKQRAPADYKRILAFFPLLEAELFRYERYGKKA